MEGKLVQETRSDEYWLQKFDVNQQVLEDLYNLIIEENRPFDIEELAIALIRRQIERESEKLRKLQDQGVLYRPQDSYEIGQKLVFPALEYSSGTVIEQRSGSNPEYGEFAVIKVQMDDDNQNREFAAKFPYSHRLNEGIVGEDEKADLVPEEIYAQCGAVFVDKLRNALEQTDLDFISFDQQWFLKGLLVEVNQGHLNISDAMIDIAQEALSTRRLMKEIELPEDSRMTTRVYSLNYTLQDDPRFVEVGPEGHIKWYLRRIMPYEVLFPPRRLVLNSATDGMDFPLHPDLEYIKQEIDDEWTDLPTIEKPDKLVVELSYVHRRMGTMPLTWKTRTLFPDSNSGIVKVTLQDKDTNNQFTAWVVNKHRYIWGLEEWYAENEVPVGAYITVEPTDDPLMIAISLTPKRKKREWTRILQIIDNQLTFTMNKIQYACEYNELSLIADDDPEQSDAYWVTIEQSGVSIKELVNNIFLELVKLSPQGTVHAKTLYNSVNVAKRLPPHTIFAEISRRGCFIPAGGGYWSYDETLADVEYTTLEEVKERS